MTNVDVPPIAPIVPPTPADAKKLAKEIEADKKLAIKNAATIEDEKDKLLKDKIKLYQEAVAENASPYVLDELRRELGMDGEEIALHIARGEYVEQYKKNKKEHKLKLNIDKVKASLGISKKIAEEDYFSQEYKNTKESYDQARQALERKLCHEKMRELDRDPSLSYQQVQEAFLKYKATEVLGKVYVEEKRKLAKQKTEGSPVKPYWKQALNWYVKLPKPARIALNTGIFTIGAVSFGIVGAAGAGAYAGYKFTKGLARSYTIGQGTALAVQGIDLKNKKKDEAFAEYQKAQMEVLGNQFAANSIDLKKYDEEMLKLDEAEKKRLRNRARAKMAVGLTMSAVLGGGTELLASGQLGINLGGDNIEKPEVAAPVAGEVADQAESKPGFFKRLFGFNNYPGRSLGPDEVGPAPEVEEAGNNDNGTVEEEESKEDNEAEEKEESENNEEEQEEANEEEEEKVEEKEEETEQEQNEEKPEAVSVEVAKGHGAIQTIQELQEKLEAEYPDEATRPASVQHILDTKADKLAIEYGMFDPSKDAESAMLQLGGRFNVDESGNVSYSQSEGGTPIELAKGDAEAPSGKYDGKMFDSDRSGSRMVSPEKVSEFEASNSQTGLEGDAPERINQNIQVDEQPLNGGDAPEKINQNIQVDEQAITPGENDGLKSNLTQGRNEDIAPLEGKWDNSNGTNTEMVSPNSGGFNTTGGGETIYRAGDSGQSQIQGNGFTKGPIPMTNVAQAEIEARERMLETLRENEAAANAGQNNIENVGGNKEVSMNKIEADARHLEDAKEVRDTFGRSNVVIDKPTYVETNGVENNKWNNAVDNTFEQKKLDFASYDEYEKERTMQTLLGNGQTGNMYDKELDKVVEATALDYYREQPEWKIVNKIPAKDFFDMNNAQVSTEEMQTLINKGIVVGTQNSAGAITDLSFKNEEELVRMSKLYEKIDPLNAKPIGDEPLEKYITRITRDIHRTEDNTLYALKKDADISETALDRNEFREGDRTSRGMQRQSYSVRQSNYQNPMYDYSPETVRRALRGVDVIAANNRWTVPVGGYGWYRR